MSQIELFHVDPGLPAEPAEHESADQRRTRRQAELLASGRHPLSSPLGFPLPLHPDAAPAADRTAPGLRCGSCQFRQLLRHHDRVYGKCYLPGPVTGRPVRVTNGAATDVRVWWPACRDYQPEV